jgi:hypothetical protein
MRFFANSQGIPVDTDHMMLFADDAVLTRRIE